MAFSRVRRPLCVDGQTGVAVELFQDPPRSAPDPPRCRCRSSFSPRYSHDRDSCAFRREAARSPCRDNNSRRRRRRRRADRRRGPWRSASRRNRGFRAILATASHTAMSIVPTATERSPWPPGFSFFISVAQIRSGSKLSPLASSRGVGRGLTQARREAFADQTTLAIAAVRIEAVADDRDAVTVHVGDDGHE